MRHVQPEDQDRAPYPLAYKLIVPGTAVAAVILAVVYTLSGWTIGGAVTVGTVALMAYTNWIVGKGWQRADASWRRTERVTAELHRKALDRYDRGHAFYQRSAWGSMFWYLPPSASDFRPY